MNRQLRKRLVDLTAAMQGERATGRCFHATFALRQGKIISIGVNNYLKEHPRHIFGDYTSKYPGDYTAGLHSEVDCIRKLKETKNLVFVNVRLDKKGRPALAKCCKNCERVMREKGFKKMFYSTAEGFEQCH